MPITTGFNHVATVTADLDRLVSFYKDVFGAEVTFEMAATEDHPRMSIVDIGGGAALNVFEAPAESIVGDRRTQGGRGPIDHYGIADDDERVNPWGGAIAVGHPLASSGVRLMTQLSRQFAERPDVRYGLTAMCIGMGMGGTVIWENPDWEGDK